MTPPRDKGSGRIIRGENNSIAAYTHPLTNAQRIEIKMQRDDDRMSRIESRQQDTYQKIEDVNQKIDENHAVTDQKLAQILQIVKENAGTCGDFMRRAMVIEDHVDVNEQLDAPIRIGELKKRVVRAERVTTPVLSIARFLKTNWIAEMILSAIFAMLWAWLKSKAKGDH